MTRRGRICILAILLAAFIAGILLLLLPSAEPSYEGQPLSYWLQRLDYEGGNPGHQTREALDAMGTRAIGKLIAMVQKHDSLIKRKFIAFAKRHPALYINYIQTRRIIPEETYRAEAASALGLIGPSARAAIPALLAASRAQDDDVAICAKAALIRIRQDPVTQLLPVIGNPLSTNWTQTVLVAARLGGTNAEAAVPFLVSELHSTNTAVRRTAAFALGQIISRPDLALPELSSLLQEKDRIVRELAATAIRTYKENNGDVEMALLLRLQGSEEKAWIAAAEGLQLILNDNDKQTLLVPFIHKSLTNANPAIRSNATLFLKRADPAVTAGGK